MAGLTTSGLGSGLNISSMVSQLVAAERGPTDTRLAQKETQLQAKISAVGTVKSAFSDLRTSLAALRDAKALDKISAGSSDTSILTASADATTAKAGSYAVVVSQLAQSHALASKAFTSATDEVMARPLGTEEGSLTITRGTESKTIKVDGSNNTLSGLRDAINSAGSGVTAAIVNDGSGFKLTLTSNATGAGNNIGISVTDPDGTNGDATGLSAFVFNATDKQLSETRQAKDALLSINGLDITSASNTVSTAVTGVTFNLAQAQTAKTVNVTVAQDTGSFTNAVKAMIDKYNAVVDSVAQVSNYDAGSKQAGPLLSDSGVRSAVGHVRNIMIQPVNGLTGTITGLQDVGITAQRDGKLVLDTSKFNAALNTNKADVITLFTGSDGLSNKLDTALGSILDTGGLLPSRSDGLQKSIDQIGKQRSALNTRMDKLQARLSSQFNAMDRLLGQLNATGAAFTQQMSALTKSTSG